MPVEWIGWVASAVFASSYFWKHPKALRWVQASAAVLWIVYGLVIHAMPVIVANALVAAVAVFSSFSGAHRTRI